MRTRITYILIGFFVGIVLIEPLSTFLSAYKIFGNSAWLEFRIAGSASGLTVGSPVRFAGLQIGYVTNINIDGVDPNYVLIFSFVEATAPVYGSTPAEVTYDAEGLARIDMQAGDNSGPNILEEAAERGSFAVLNLSPPKSRVAINPSPDSSFWTWLSERSVAELSALIAGFCVLLWIAAVSFLYWIRPSWIIALHERMPEPAKIERTATLFEKASFGAATIVCWTISTLLLFFASRPRALDAWVNEKLVDARLIFEQRPSVRDRQIALDLPVRIGTIHYNEPWAAIRQLVSTSAPVAALISGPGGAGKTTLAFEFARRAIDTADDQQLGLHPMVPLLVELDVPDKAAAADGFVPYIAGMLRIAVNEKHRITTRLTSALLKAGRILLVVDGLSERSTATRNAFNPQRQGFEPLRLVVTSRDQTMPGMNTLIETESIPSGALFGFISGYMKEIGAYIDGERPAEDEIFEACAQLKRILGDTPCTPLLATMWAEEIGASQNGSNPRGIASLMDSYVRRLLLPATRSNEAQVSQLTKDAAKIAELELGEKYLPSYITRAAALEVLRQLESTEPENRFAIMERSRILESPSQSDIVRISPDPVAEHLVSRLKCEELGSDEKGWRDLLDALRNLHLPDGFVMALAACADDEVHGRQLPQSIRDQIVHFRSNVAKAQSAT